MSRILASLGRVRRRRQLGEQGFSLIELVVATGVMALVMSGLAFLGTAAFGDIAVARSRQTASSLANEALEQVRALPYDTVALGLNTTELSDDDAITFSN